MFTWFVKKQNQALEIKNIFQHYAKTVADGVPIDIYEVPFYKNPAMFSMLTRHTDSKKSIETVCKRVDIN